MANLVIESIKKVFYRIYPTSHISAFLRTIYLQKYIRRFRFTKVLDAGCGTGQFTFYLAKKYPGTKFTGYDLSEQDIGKCQDKKQELYLDNVQFKQLDLFELNEEEQYDLELLEGHLMPDHAHILISIPLKYAVSQVVGFIKGKSAIHIAREYFGRKKNFTGQHFWARGYHVSTVGRDEEAIRKYIREQEQEDRRIDQLN